MYVCVGGVHKGKEFQMSYAYERQNASDNYRDYFIQAIAIGRMFIHEEHLKEKEWSLRFYRGR